MKLIIAKSSGFCYGVSRSIELAEKACRDGKKCYTLGQLIHNRQAVEKLEKQGIHEADSLDDIPDGSTVIIRSHGVGRDEIERIGSRRLDLVDATCPNVARIHEIVSEASKRGEQVIVIGEAHHPEVEGICKWCNAPLVFRDDIELQRWLDESPENREINAAVVFQTTSSYSVAEVCNKIIKKQCTNFRIFDTICFATSKRQNEAREISSFCDCMIVIGGKNSANTQHLAEICRNNVSRMFFIENTDELDLSQFGEHDTVGIIAGASTPAWIIKEVGNKMCEEFEIKELTEENTTAENTENEGESFAEMLEKSIKTLHTGDKVTGTVTNITATEITVDLGTKQSGYIPLAELTDDPTLKVEDIVQIGSQIETYVMRVNDVEGTVQLSKKRLDAVKIWSDIEQYCADKTTVEGIVTDENKGGVVASVKGIRVFIPASQCGLPSGVETSTLLKNKVRLRITEVNRSRRRVVGSIRAVAYEERKAKAEKIWNEIEVGAKYTGVVKSLTSYGAFVDIGGIDGMVHVSELSWSRIGHPSEVLSVGQQVEVYVVSFDKEKKKISLGYKNPDDNPWKKFLETYSVGSVARVRIVKLIDFGAFAEILPGIDGLIHISQIADHRIGKPAEVLTVGEEVDAKIIAIDEDKHRISLSIRALLEPKNEAEEVPAESAEEPEPANNETEAE